MKNNSFLFRYPGNFSWNCYKTGGNGIFPDDMVDAIKETLDRYVRDGLIEEYKHFVEAE